MTPEEIVARGDRAQALWNDPALQEALETVKAGVRDTFFQLPVEAKEQREFLHLMDKARQQFENVLQLLINNATVSHAELLEAEHTAMRVDAINRRTLNG